MYTMMNTIQKTYERCKAENIGISLNYLRYICRNNIIPVCKCGNKYLINWDVFMKYLNGELVSESEPASVIESCISEDNDFYNPIKAKKVHKSKIRALY